ncbi:MAG: DUF3078 domain-containing protein [Bacteroidota bacterium]
MRHLGLMFLSFTLVANAQVADTSYWKHNGVGGVTVTQVSYTDWAQGGENALAWTASLEGKSIYAVESSIWTTNYNFAYGNTKLGSQGVRKTDDKIDMASEFKYIVGVDVNPYVAASFKTQFTKGYAYDALGVGTPISDFFDPAFLTQSAGAGYQPVPEVKTRIGVALREILTNTYTNYSGGEKTSVEGGMESVTELDARLEENLFFKSKLELFSPFRKMEEVVVRSDNTLIAKISQYFSTNLNVQIIHEKPISARTQVKQTLALGFSYVLF